MIVQHDIHPRLNNGYFIPNQINIVENIEKMLSNQSEDYNFFYVKDPLAGGLFFLKENINEITVNQGTVFASTFNGKHYIYERIYDKNIPLNPLWFGAKGDGETDDSSALQKMFDIISDKQEEYYHFKFPTGYTFCIKKGLIIKESFTKRRKIIIEGYGAKIVSQDKITMISKSNALDDSATNDKSIDQIIIKGLEFWDVSKDQGMVELGVGIANSYNGSIEDCRFKGLMNGLALKLFMGGQVKNCEFINCWDRNIYFNQECNNSKIELCRVYSNPPDNCLSGYEIQSSSSVKISNCIYEGKKMAKNGVIYTNNTRKAGNVKNLTIENIHVEMGSNNIPPNNYSILKVGRWNGGIITLKDLWNQVRGLIIADYSHDGVSGGNGTLNYLKITNLVYLPANSKFKTYEDFNNINNWIFEDCKFNPLKKKYWIGTEDPNRKNKIKIR